MFLLFLVKLYIICFWRFLFLFLQIKHILLKIAYHFYQYKNNENLTLQLNIMFFGFILLPKKFKIINKTDH